MTNKLQNLNHLINRVATRYTNEFVWQDVHLTDEFKRFFSEYLSKSGGSTIDFFDTTAVITTPTGKTIFVPNQWFVIASYPVSVCKELLRYKEYLVQIANRLGSKKDDYIKNIRDNHTVKDKEVFINVAKDILSENMSGDEVLDSAAKLWRFATDYSWWSGQKTIDRGDFYVSVMLNMLNLVNASQGYVADIVNAYVNDYPLSCIIKRIDYFTVDLDCVIIDDDTDLDSAPADAAVLDIPSDEKEVVTTNEGGKVRIKISDKKKKVIRFKG